MNKMSLFSLFAFVLLALPGLAQSSDTYKQGSDAWQDLKWRQPSACNYNLDSQEILVGHKTKYTALILHGYSQNPQRMAEIAKSFTGNDINVLVPRLSHHYDKNFKSLDDVSYNDWLAQTRAAFK